MSKTSGIRVYLRPPHQRSVVIHSGPTNSGKTHAALKELASANKGAYLAPLRLLAWEAAERLAELGCPTDLLTGEEHIRAPGARAVAATVEMLPPGSYDVVVVDEAQMIADHDRGWAWTRALMQVDTAVLHVCCAPHALRYLEELFRRLGDEVAVEEHGRLLPLRPLENATPLSALPPRSAVVAFSRLGVLRLKAEIERLHHAQCAVIYGGLPPDVRREQARLVQSGEAQFVAATDAIGLGLNFPVDRVILTDVFKFDGKMQRQLRPEEAQQIVGRAGRFGLATEGFYGGLNPQAHKNLLGLAIRQPAEIRQGYLQPSLADLQTLRGRIGKRIEEWLGRAAPEFGDLVRLADTETMIRLASWLPVDLELELAYTLVTAPVSEPAMPYWLDTVHAVARGWEIPEPKMFVGRITTEAELTRAEGRLRQYDLCLWLVRHRGLAGPDEPRLHRERNLIAREIERALLAGIKMAGCQRCGAPLPPGHPYRICDACFHGY